MRRFTMLCAALLVVCAALSSPVLAGTPGPKPFDDAPLASFWEAAFGVPPGMGEVVLVVDSEPSDGLLYTLALLGDPAGGVPTELGHVVVQIRRRVPLVAAGDWHVVVLDSVLTVGNGFDATAWLFLVEDGRPDAVLPPTLILADPAAAPALAVGPPAHLLGLPTDFDVGQCLEDVWLFYQLWVIELDAEKNLSLTLCTAAFEQAELACEGLPQDEWRACMKAAVTTFNTCKADAEAIYQDGLVEARAWALDATIDCYLECLADCNATAEACLLAADAEKAEAEATCQFIYDDNVQDIQENPNLFPEEKRQLLAEERRDLGECLAEAQAAHVLDTLSCRVEQVLCLTGCFQQPPLPDVESP